MAAKQNDGLALRHAALIAGFGYLLMPVSYAQFVLIPRLVVPGATDQTIRNIAAHGRLFAVAILCYLTTCILDIVISWALYFLLLPVNKALSLLAAWLRLMYTAMALVALFNLVNVFRLVGTADYLAAFGSQQFIAQVKLQLNAYQYDWSFSLIVFGVHLVMLGYLIFRSSYIPRLIGVLLVINGLGWIVDSLKAYLYPGAPLGFVFYTFFGELVFMAWLLIRGWKIKEPLADA